MARFFQPKKQSTINKKHQLVQVARMDHHGEGIAYLEGKPVFIEGALPTEQVLIQLTENKSKYARAKLIQVKQESAERTKPFCPHYHRCGGCNLQHLSHREQVRYKQESLSQLLNKFAGLSVPLSPVVSDVDLGYRRRARFSLKWDSQSKRLAFGFRQKNSNHIVDIEHCAVLAPTLESLIPQLRALFESMSQPEKLGHLELIAADNGTVMLLRTIGPLTDSDQADIVTFAQQRHVSLYMMAEAGNPRLLNGHEPVYRDTGIEISFQPHHFIQINRHINQKMVHQALAWLALSEEDRVLDLFCGVGNFSLPIAQQVKSLVGVEGIEEMVVQARNNAALNQIVNAAFYQANLEKTLIDVEWAQAKFDKVLLDPARAGAKGVIELLSDFGAQRVVYVSCDPATLARDSQQLLQQGYQLEKVGMLDMFPHTSHLESMALFIKM
ncbi:23S rRNA (uracil(1939)-C(5))-methyltransferase RlmD [Vibrio spartinae]|uniref:23S rRNA (uracil(1939)-C(5))-methyltransferase RlmD n=1 Tax=Vibrio spartinae TaxID=1918945 RepID=A0A1N6M430_9VIBR|nr:23S rRNA (uracil(1939)-C(5))-methyltransferase RlmD [Vibrio spartinae]QMV13294.1 23S rRNA (uracil(1939)-C(5))-methyltransferase RlmD [Vibrio spartinae]SIO94175.1 23S rRNA (uracil(1939)-C(5))-methyltransferase RlmD [Vibrio spartinae]